MSKEKSAAYPMFREFVQVGIYKRNQGRVTRQVTAGALMLIAALGCWRLSDHLAATTKDRFWELGFPVLLWLAFAWLSYRIVNLPMFADFLISVETEMNKVSWPARLELVRSSIVVIVFIVLLTSTLLFFDAVCANALRYLVGL